MANPEDARGIAEVFYKTWLVTYPNKKVGITVDDIEDRFRNSFTEESLAKRAKQIANPAEGKFFFLAKNDDRIVGVCVAVRHPDKNQLQAIYVLPEYQGRGIGRLLWGEAQKYFSADKDTIVQVAIYNTKAIDFYRKLGFAETSKQFQNEHFRMKSGVIIPETEMVIKAKKTK